MFYRKSSSGKQFKGQFTPPLPKNPTELTKSTHQPKTCPNLGHLPQIPPNENFSPRYSRFTSGSRSSSPGVPVLKIFPSIKM
jgi:hypothetical protein